MRIIAKGGIGEQDAVFVKTRRPETETALKIILYTQHHGGHMPEVIPFVGEGITVPGPSGETARLITERIMRLLFKRTQWVITNGNPVGIAREFGTWSAVL